jgi:hypothetical protein
MTCLELERLESEQVRIRTAQRNPGLSDPQKEALASAEVEIVKHIKDHRCFGHDGHPCFGD